MSTASREAAAARGDDRRSADKRSGQGLGLAVIAAVQLLITLDTTIVYVALPKIQGALHLSTVGLSWIVTSYALTFGASLLLAGRLGDIAGRRRLFTAGIVAFTATSLVAGLANSEALLLTMRAAQGISAAFAAANALSLITTTFPEGVSRNRALGVYSAMAAAGGAVGMLAGGVLTDLVSWRWIFFVNVPIGILVAVLTPRSLDETPRTSMRLDIPGVLTGTFGVALLVYGFSNTAEAGWSAGSTLVLLAAAVAFLAAFVLIESRAREPLMPLWILRDRQRAGSYLMMLLLNAAVFGAFFFLTQVFQRVLGYSALVAGLAFLPASIGFVAGAALASQLASRHAARVLAALGSVVATVGLGWLARSGPGSSYVSIVLPLLLMAVGTGFAFVVLTITATANVDPANSGLASGTLSTFRQIGLSAGLALLATIAISSTKGDLAALGRHPAAAAVIQAASAGYRVGFAVAAALTLVAAVAAVLTLSRAAASASAAGAG